MTEEDLLFKLNRLALKGSHIILFNDKTKQYELTNVKYQEIGATTFTIIYSHRYNEEVLHFVRSVIKLLELNYK